MGIPIYLICEASGSQALVSERCLQPDLSRESRRRSNHGAHRPSPLAATSSATCCCLGSAARSAGCSAAMPAAWSTSRERRSRPSTAPGSGSAGALVELRLGDPDALRQEPAYGASAWKNADLPGHVCQARAAMDGFISIERFQSFSDPTKLLALSIWRDEATVEAFRNWEVHRGVQTNSRKDVFLDYRLRVAAVLRDYGLTEREQAPVDSRAAHV